jgi:predicted DNA repair protein MutK
MPASLIALLDDIASVLDDVALMTKTAATKTAGVLGDDLALNAQQVSGVSADRELPVVWAVAKGSAINKAILVPAALAISALAPWAVTPLLMAGGVFLCYEGCEKLAHRTHDGDAAMLPPDTDLVAHEREKIRGAIRTDFVLSAEIVTISLGSVAGAPVATQFGVLAAVAVLMTVGVYGVVAAIVKIDDLGLYLVRHGGPRRAVGEAILAAAPWLMKGLSVAGTAAVFVVGGGILVHAIAPLRAMLAPERGGLAGSLLGLLGNAATGVVAGGIALALVKLFVRLRRPPRAASGP